MLKFTLITTQIIINYHLSLTITEKNILLKQAFILVDIHIFGYGSCHAKRPVYEKKVFLGFRDINDIINRFL